MASNSGEGESNGSNPSIESSSQAQPTIWLERLPREIYFDILSRQSIFSLLECKLVSRNWHSTIKDPLLANMHLTRSTKNNPCLLFFSDWPKSKLQLVQLGHPEPETRTIKMLKTPFEFVLPEFEVVGSCNGLVCLYNYYFDDPLYIYNPFTIEYRELPRLFGSSPHSNICRVVFGFGFHPRTKDYKVMKIIYFRQGNNDLVGGKPEVFVLTLANNIIPIWRNIGEIGYDLTGPTSEALVNGKLHWLSFNFFHEDIIYRKIVSFDLQNEQFQVVPGPTCGGLDRTNHHLLSLRGCLSAIVSSNDGSNEIWVMNVYNVKTSWRKEFVIGNYVPQGLRLDMAPPARRRKNGYQGREFRVLCGLKNGEILCLYRSSCVVTYNPDSGEFKELNFQGLPLEYQAIVHMGSLISVIKMFSN